MSAAAGFETSDDADHARTAQCRSLYRLAGAPEVSGETPLTDPHCADWHKTAVLWAYQTGVTSGVSETTFAPDTPVTREQVAVFLARFADRVLDRYTPHMWDALFPFQDREQISCFMRGTAMNWACDLEGLIKAHSGPGRPAP
ncbi:MAG: S-layer homology domain-containing protein [Oscillospiraceae bacterium]